MVDISLKSLAREQIVFQQGIAHQISGFRIDERQGDQIILVLRAFELMAAISYVYVHTLSVKDVAIIVTVLTHQRDNLRVDLNAFHVSPAGHQRI